jgi:hypothetical protein
MIVSVAHIKLGVIPLLLIFFSINIMYSNGVMRSKVSLHSIYY